MTYGRTTILQCNINGLTNNKTELQRVLNAMDITCACIMETWLNPDKTQRANIHNYNIITTNREDGYGGTAIYIKKGINYSSIPHPLSNEDIQITQIKTNQPKLTIVSVYAKPTTRTEQFKHTITRLLNMNEYRNNTIITADLNCHHTSWGNLWNDNKGNFFVNEIEETNLTLLHQEEMTFIPTDKNKNPTAIDLTIISQEIMEKSSRQVLEQHIGATNHKTILTTIDTNTPPPHRTYLNKPKLLKEINQITPPDNCTTGYIISSINKLIKNNRHKQRKKPKIWWNIETEKAWHNKNKARKTFDRHRTTLNQIEYNKTLAIFRRTKTLHKRQKYEEKLTEIDTQTNTKELWRLMNNLEGKNIRNSNTNIVHMDEHAARKFLEINFKKNIRGNEYIYLGLPPMQKILDKEKWDYILNKKKNTAPGHDRITYEMLRHMNNDTTNKMLNEANKMWNRGRLQKKYKRIRIIAIPKPNKDHNNPANYRPIALIPTITKTINSAVLMELNKQCEEKNLIPETSFGFRQKKTINHSINLITNQANENYRNKKITGLIFIDIKSAYNNVNTKNLINILEKSNISPDITRWIANFQKNRTMEVNVNGKFVTKLTTEGLLQGDVLSPTLFNIYTRDLHQNTGKIEILQYADDFVLLQSSKNAERLQIKLQEAINTFANRAEELKLPINVEKTKFMIIGKEPHDNIQIEVNGKKIDKVPSYRYLGTWLDQNMNFKKEIETLKNKARGKLNIMKRICHPKNNLSPKKTAVIHKNLIRSTFEHGITYLSNAQNKLINSMTTIVSQSLRKISGCTKTTPINTLYAINAEIPPQIRANFTSTKETAKTIAYSKIHKIQLENSRNRTRKNKTHMEKIYEQYRDRLNIMEDMQLNNLHHNTKIREHIEDNLKKKNNTELLTMKQSITKEINTEKKTRTIIYTDGSKTGCETGIGIHITHPISNRYWSYSFKLKNTTEITTVEIIAIEKATELALQNHIQKPIIYTDSQTACKLLKNCKYQTYIGNSIYNILKNCETLDAEIRWIPGHLGIAGNEKADHLAKQGTKSNNAIDNNIRIEDIITEAKNQMMHDTKQWYKNLCGTKGKKFEKYQQQFEQKPWYHDLPLKATEIKIANRILSGHSLSKYWLKKMQIEDNGNCNNCKTPETTTHLIFECPRYRRDSRMTQDKLEKHWKDNDGRYLKTIIEFITNNKIPI
uniref:Reverse transcriptase domain-containing protein n=1 Tax=Anopheles atroparvus TaxID=41427 RepID=A0AAG5DGU8_ANOAO